VKARRAPRRTSGGWLSSLSSLLSAQNSVEVRALYRASGLFISRAIAVHVGRVWS
jgi:hypothetical protein